MLIRRRWMISDTSSMSSLAGMLEPEILTNIARTLRISKSTQLAGFITLVYDHVLTIDDEMQAERIWKERLSGASLLFLLNRYVSLLRAIVGIAAFHHPRWAGAICDHVVHFLGSSSVVVTSLCGLLMILRVYALYRRSNTLLAFLLSIWIAQLVASAVGVSKAEALQLPPGPGFVGCILSAPSKWFAVNWAGPLILDGTVFFLTLWRTREYIFSSDRIPLLHILVRDGTLYFLVIFLVNLSNAFLFFFAPQNLKPVTSPLSVMLTSTMVSRLVLNLRSAPSAGINIVNTAVLPRPNTSIVFSTMATLAIGNMGEDGALEGIQARLRQTLASLSRVSETHLNACRPILYRNLSLKNSRSNHETISLLLDSSLAVSCERLELITDTPLKQAAWVPLDAIKHMENLRVLVLGGASPFPDSEHQQEFVGVLSKYCPNLKELEVNVSSQHPRFDIEPLQGDFGIKGLTKLKWLCTRGVYLCLSSCSPERSFLIVRGSYRKHGTPFSHPASRSLLQASRTTLTHISFPNEIDDFEAANIVQFSALHFPVLQSLVLGPWLDVFTEEPPSALVRFLAAHPTITDFDLGYFSDDEFRADLEPAALQAATTPVLPALRHLHAHPSPICDLARHAPLCFKSLTSLEVGTGLEEDVPYEYRQLFTALKAIGGLPNLKRLRYYVGESEGDDVMCMEAFSSLCPLLEVWAGDLPWELLGHLSKFKNLREVFVRRTTIPEPCRLSVTHEATNLGSKCLQLSKFVARYTGIPRAVFVVRISRNLEECITSTNLSEEDPLQAQTIAHLCALATPGSTSLADDSEITDMRQQDGKKVIAHQEVCEGSIWNANIRFASLLKTLCEDEAYTKAIHPQVMTQLLTCRVGRTSVFEEYTWSKLPVPWVIYDLTLRPARVPWGVYFGGVLAGEIGSDERTLDAADPRKGKRFTQSEASPKQTLLPNHYVGQATPRDTAHPLKIIKKTDNGRKSIEYLSPEELPLRRRAVSAEYFNHVYYLEHCLPSIQQIVKRLHAIREEYALSARAVNNVANNSAYTMGKLSKVYILTNGWPSFVNRLRGELLKDGWEAVFGTLDMERAVPWSSFNARHEDDSLALTKEERGVSVAIDMALAERAEVFVENGSVGQHRYAARSEILSNLLESSVVV
ncbi:unnamed protein product [Cyclocybe aegerita]|uniref:DUF6533 domain-containing protein n=1 Tax=Cyclocybe aegerita TaxID=1973307 RepID=A0A8S0WJM9_CYCAE|nr:unnamed protein product [Cyclocybe aegerita]